MDLGTLSRFGKYQLRATLGCSSGHAVYEAWDPAIQRHVVIKTLPLASADPDNLDQLLRFRREAQAAGRLNDLNIAGVYDYGETDEFAYIVMEFVPGRSLK